MAENAIVRECSASGSRLKVSRVCYMKAPIMTANSAIWLEKEIKMSKGQSLQEPYLNALRKERVPVSIYLVNGIKLQGQIESFDQFVVLLKNTVSQMIYKHAISTVVPSRNVKFSEGDT